MQVVSYTPDSVSCINKLMGAFNLARFNVPVHQYGSSAMLSTPTSRIDIELVEREHILQFRVSITRHNACRLFQHFVEIPRHLYIDAAPVPPNEECELLLAEIFAPVAFLVLDFPSLSGLTMPSRPPTLLHELVEISQIDKQFPCLHIPSCVLIRTKVLTTILLENELSQWNRPPTVQISVSNLITGRDIHSYSRTLAAPKTMHDKLYVFSELCNSILATTHFLEGSL